nr:MAG: putative RNA-dependent RNA polymerase [Sanya botourmia-like virus 8]
MYHFKNLKLESMETTKEKNDLKSLLTKKLLFRWVEGGEIALRSLSPVTTRALIRIEQFRILSQRVWNVRLPPVKRANWDTKSLKNFCEEVLDRGCYHEWRTSLLRVNHASLRVRVAVASSLFLFRKVIPQEMTPAEVKEKTKKYIEKMTEAQSPPSPSFMVHVRRWTRRLFRDGWDKSWEKSKEGFTLPTSACVESKRSEGGPRGLDRERIRNEYRSFVAGSRSGGLSRETVPMMIWTGGKWRLVTKFPYERSFLAPVHRTIYNHLSKKKWLLRGEATPDRFEDFTRVDGEIFVSGDYESATDNLNIWVSLAILSEMSRTSTHIPRAVWDAAIQSMKNRFPNGKVQQRGQLMGSLLSFPLLCLTNFIAFKWAIPRKVPVRINGDDIVFRCRPDEKDRWFKEIRESGLAVSRGKTLVEKTVFSLNSAFFLPQTNTVKACPSIRSTCLFGPAEDATAVSGRLRSVFAFGSGAGLRLTQVFALKEMRKQVWASQRSVMRGLCSTTSWRVLKAAGLKDREIFYNKLTKEIPLPVRQKEWMQNAIPDNYTRVPACSVRSEDDPDFYREMVECTWSRDPKKREGAVDNYWQAVREGTFRYVPLPPLKFGLMAGFSEREYLEFSNRVVNSPRVTKKMVWVKDPRGALASGGPSWDYGGTLGGDRPAFQQ